MKFYEKTVKGKKGDRVEHWFKMRVDQFNTVDVKATKEIIEQHRERYEKFLKSLEKKEVKSKKGEPKE